MNLIAAIQSYPGKTAQEIRTLLAADAIIATNSVSQSLAGVGKELAKQGVDPDILTRLRALVFALPIGGDTMEGFLLTGGGEAGGVDFTLPEIRYQIWANQQHPNTTEEQQVILEGMLLIGITPGAEWQRIELDALPELADIQSAIDIQTTADWISQVRDMINAAVGTSATIPQLKTTIAGM